jgi:hypothetical protein
VLQGTSSGSGLGKTTRLVDLATRLPIKADARVLHGNAPHTSEPGLGGNAGDGHDSCLARIALVFHNLIHRNLRKEAEISLTRLKRLFNLILVDG